MSYIEFDKKELVNLEFTLNRELLHSNRSGAFYNTTIIGCNTRKYHGLLVVPQPQLDNNNHVLLASLDETIIENKEEFHLGVHMYPDGIFAPRGHKYLQKFIAEPIPKLTYRVGGVLLTKEYIFAENEARILIRYTLEDSVSPIVLRLLPFLAFRNVHMLTHENHFANRKYEPARNGVSWQLYQNYSHLFLQFSRAAEYTHVPHWYYNLFYVREQERGYEAIEDQYVPGFFELTMRKGDSVVVSAGLEDKNPATFKRQFDKEISTRIPRDSFEHCLQNSSQQFFVRDGEKTSIYAGFPWFGSCSRDTFLSLPGITLANGDEKTFNEIMQTNVNSMQGAFFPNRYYQKDLYFTAVDSPLVFFWCLQQYEAMLGKSKKSIWQRYSQPMLNIITSFMHGTQFNVKMQDNGLLYAGASDLALTWMNVFCNGKPWTPRTGLDIEVNALWYNAVSYLFDLMSAADKKNELLPELKTILTKIENSFTPTFYNAEQDLFYDYINESEKNTLIRPNMMFAASLPYSPISDVLKMKILKRIQSELLTPRGLRSLSPKSTEYKGVTIGNHRERECAYHQGSVFPWLIAHYADLLVKLFGVSALPDLENIYSNFKDVIKENGIGSISEIYDGNPPYEARACISQSTSVAAVLYVGYLINKLKGASI